MFGRRAAVPGTLAATMLPPSARAQIGGAPGRPIRILVDSSAGGANDIVAGIVAQRLAGNLGRPGVVDNKAGVSGLIAADILAKAPPDGLTLMVASQTTCAVAPSLYRAATFDAPRDVAGVALLGASPLALVVHPSLAAKSVAELVMLAKAKPGVLNVGSGGVGSTPQMAAELFASVAGVKLTAVHYRGEAPASAALMTGELPILFGNLSAVGGHVKAGTLRGLAVTSLARAPTAPELPTIAEAGLPGFDVETWFGLTAPAGTPRETIAGLNAEVGKALAHPVLGQRLADLGMSVGTGDGAALDAYIKAEAVKWGKVIKDAGIRAPG